MRKILVFLSTFIFALCLGGCNREASSVGIIGGADGPTVISVSSDLSLLSVFGFIGLIVVIFSVAIIICCKKKSK